MALRVLHLVRGASAGDGERGVRACFGALRDCARVIADSPRDEHRVVLIGDSDARRDADSAGLRVDRWLRAPLGMARLLGTRVARERAWGASEVMVWSAGLGGLSRGLRPAVWQEMAWARAAQDRSIREGVRTRGADGVARASENRSAIRGALGAGDGDVVVGLLADPPADGDAREFAFVLGLVEVGVGALVGVMSSGSAQLGRGRAFHAKSARRGSLEVVRGSVLAWLDGLDVGVVQGAWSLGSVEAARRAVELGIPIVGPEWLATEFGGLVGTRVFVSDGRMRSMLPGMLRALEAVRGRSGNDPG